MADFEIRDNETSRSDFTVVNKDNGYEYDVSVTHYGYEVSRRSSGGGGGIPLALLWVASIIFMPIIFFTEKIYQYESAPVLYCIAYLVSLTVFLFTFFPGLKNKQLPIWLKKFISMAFPIFMYLILVFSAIIYFTLGNGNCDFLFIYICPIMVYGVILYHVRDFNLIPLMMEKLHVKKYSFIATYFLQWLAICVIFYYGIMMPFGDALGEFLIFILCYLYVILVDVKKFWLLKRL